MKGHTYLNKPTGEYCRFVLVCITFYLRPGVKGLTLNVLLLYRKALNLTTETTIRNGMEIVPSEYITYSRSSLRCCLNPRKIAPTEFVLTQFFQILVFGDVNFYNFPVGIYLVKVNNN